MRIIKLELGEPFGDFKVWNRLAILPKDLKDFATPFEHVLIEALTHVELPTRPTFNLSAGIQIREAQEEGSWTTGYGPTIDVAVGQPLFVGTIYTWLHWSSIDILGARGHRLHDSILLSRFDLTRVHEKYESLIGDYGDSAAHKRTVSQELTRFLYSMCVEQGLRNNISILEHTAAQHYAAFQAATELQKLLHFFDPSRR